MSQDFGSRFVEWLDMIHVGVWLAAVGIGEIYRFRFGGRIAGGGGRGVFGIAD